MSVYLKLVIPHVTPSPVIHLQRRKGSVSLASYLPVPPASTTSRWQPVSHRSGASLRPLPTPQAPTGLLISLEAPLSGLQRQTRQSYLPPRIVPSMQALSPSPISSRPRRIDGPVIDMRASIPSSSPWARATHSPLCKFAILSLSYSLSSCSPIAAQARSLRV
jgi:hypothetical protein